MKRWTCIKGESLLPLLHNHVLLLPLRQSISSVGASYKYVDILENKMSTFRILFFLTGYGYDSEMWGSKCFDQSKIKRKNAQIEVGAGVHAHASPSSPSSSLSSAKIATPGVHLNLPPVVPTRPSNSHSVRHILHSSTNMLMSEKEEAATLPGRKSTLSVPSSTTDTDAIDLLSMEEVELMNTQSGGNDEKEKKKKCEDTSQLASWQVCILKLIQFCFD